MVIGLGSLSSVSLTHPTSPHIFITFHRRNIFKTFIHILFYRPPNSSALDIFLINAPLETVLLGWGRSFNCFLLSGPCRLPQVDLSSVYLVVFFSAPLSVLLKYVIHHFFYCLRQCVSFRVSSFRGRWHNDLVYGSLFGSRLLDVLIPLGTARFGVSTFGECLLWGFSLIESGQQKLHFRKTYLSGPGPNQHQPPQPSPQMGRFQIDAWLWLCCRGT